MWKKLGVALIALLSTFSVVYAMNRDMFAAGTISNPFELKEGNKFYMGENASEEVSWDIGVVKSDEYVTLISTSLGSLELGADSTPCSGIVSNTYYKYCDYDSTTPIYNKIKTFNDSAFSSNEKTYIIDQSLFAGNEFKYAFLPKPDDLKNGGRLGVTTKSQVVYVAGTKTYVLAEAGYMETSAATKAQAFVTDNEVADGDRLYDTGGVMLPDFIGFMYSPYSSGWRKSETRPYMVLNKSKVVFGIDAKISGIELSEISRPSTTQGDGSSNDGLKLRVNDGTIAKPIFKIENLKNGNGMISSNSFDLNYTADTGDNRWITMIMVDKSVNEMKYYKRLELAKSSGSISVDITDLDLGKYTLYLVVETVDDNTKRPSVSSLLSNGVDVEILKAHTIAYSATPQNQSTYEYDKNVDKGQKIGEITRNDGAVPIHYELVADGADQTFQNFEITGLNAKGDSSAPSLDVKVKSSGAPDVISGTNSLKAGTYKFCVISKDTNGDPVTDVVGQNKVCTSLVVEKATPTISFTDPTKKDMTIGSSDYIGDITYSNTDNVLPSNITYQLTNGISGGVLTVSSDSTDPEKYNASVLGNYAGTSLPTTFDVNVTIAETDNYKQATTTVKKEFYIYKDLSDLIWSPIKTGSFSTGDVGANTKVGSLLASDGVEDFTYEFAKQGDSGYVAADAVDNASFLIVDGTGVEKDISAEVKTASQLTEKTYKIQFKVTDSKGKVVYKSVEIVVNAQNQNAVEFKTGANGSAITEYKMKFNETNRSLFADGGSTGATIEYYLADAKDQPSGLIGTAADYAEIAKIGGLIKPKKVGTVNVYAKSPGNATYGDQLSAFMKLIIEQGEQSVKFTDTKASDVKIGGTSQETATGTVTLTNATGIGGITYKSSDVSIATVDANGKVTGIAPGSVIITAILNDSDPSNTSYDSNYETKTTTKTVNVYKGMELTWTAASPNLEGVSSGTGDLAGTISVADNSGAITYTISSNTGVENTDAAFFQLDPNNTSCGVKLVGSISAADVASHNNKFYIQVDVTDSKGTQTIDIEITIDDAENDAYFKEGSNKVTKITKQYGENNNTFNFSVNTSNGGNVIYSIVTSEPQDVVTTLATGVASIKKVGTTKAQAVVGAGSGYDGKTITIPVEITKGTQEITFDDTATTARAFVKDSQFSEPSALTETSAKTSTSRTKTYDSKDKSICTVDQAGLVTMLATGNCEIEVKNTDSNWDTTTATKTINLYEGMGVTFDQTETPQADTANAVKNSIVGKLTISDGQGTKTSIVSTANDPKNKDAEYFEVKGTNVVLKQNVTAADLANKYDAIKKKYVMYVQFETTDELDTTITTDAIIEFKGAPLNAEFDTDGTGKITEVYGKDRTFVAGVTNNSGNGTPVYQLKNDPTMPSDVLKSVAKDGTITIQNANDKTVNANPVMIEAVIPPSGGYEGKTIEVEVEITKAEQSGFKFKTPTINMQIGSSATVVLEGKLSTGKVKLISPSTTILSVNGMDITAGTKEDTLTLTARDEGDRNYKSASATATVNINSQPAYDFLISVPSATYGDTGLSATIEINDATGANQTQTWVSSDPTIADVDANGNITIYKAGSVDITCTQTSTGEPSVSSTATLVIDPKPITITINDKSKYVGEAVPGFDMTIPSGVLVGLDTISLPTFSCVDTTNTPVTSTTPTGSYSITGTYPTGANPNYEITVTPGTLTVNQDTSLASWYHLEGVTSGNTLDPTKWYNEDVKVVLDSAIEDTRTYDEISLDQSIWDASFITVNTEDENSEDVYFRVNTSGILSTSQSTTIKIDKTKPIVKNISGTPTNKDALSTLINNLTFGTFFKPGTLVNIKSEDVVPTANTKISGLSEVSYEVFEIDRKTGVMNTTPIDQGSGVPNASGEIEVKLDDIGLYRVCALTKDQAGNVSLESCSDINIKNINVDIDNDGENEFQDPGNDGCPDINIPLKDEKGVIYKINVDRDEDGIPDLNIDSNGDGIADINVDTDKDGKPDLNLVNLTKWEPTFCAKEQIDYEGKPIVYCTMKDIKAVINVDTGTDGIPDINIDTTGDMKADINIDRDGNGKLDAFDLNLTGEIKAWVPKTDYTKDKFLYDTQSDFIAKINIVTTDQMKPDINVDLTGDGLPDINIDVNGDGIPDTNIDSTGDGEPDFNLDPERTGTPQSNIVKLTTWTPSLAGEKDGIAFNTMGDIKLNDTLTDDDSGSQIQKPGGSFLPNYSIKVDSIKDSVDQENKDKIGEFVKEDAEIKDILDVKLSDGTSIIQPDGSVKVRIPVSDDLANASTVKVVLEQADGTYKEVEASVKDGYLEYETDYLGKVGIIGDKDVQSEPDPIPDSEPDVTIPDFNPSGNGGSTPNPTVKGDYSGNIGGAGTGIGNEQQYFTYACMFSILVLGFLTYRKKKI